MQIPDAAVGFCSPESSPPDGWGQAALKYLK